MDQQNMFAVMEWPTDGYKLSIHHLKYIKEPTESWNSYKVGDEGQAAYPGTRDLWPFKILAVGTTRQSLKTHFTALLKKRDALDGDSPTLSENIDNTIVQEKTDLPNKTIRKQKRGQTKISRTNHVVDDDEETVDPALKKQALTSAITTLLAERGTTCTQVATNPPLSNASVNNIASSRPLSSASMNDLASSRPLSSASINDVASSRPLSNASIVATSNFGLSCPSVVASSPPCALSIASNVASSNFGLSCPSVVASSHPLSNAYVIDGASSLPLSNASIVATSNFRLSCPSVVASSHPLSNAYVNDVASNPPLSIASVVATSNFGLSCPSVVVSANFQHDPSLLGTSSFSSNTKSYTSLASKHTSLSSRSINPQNSFVVSVTTSSQFINPVSNTTAVMPDSYAYSTPSTSCFPSTDMRPNAECFPTQLPSLQSRYESYSDHTCTSASSLVHNAFGALYPEYQLQVNQDMMVSNSDDVCNTASCHSCCKELTRLKREFQELKEEVQKLKKKGKKTATGGQGETGFGDQQTPEAVHQITTINGRSKEEIEQIVHNCVNLTEAVKITLPLVFSIEELMACSLKGQYQSKAQPCARPGLDEFRRNFLESLLSRTFGVAVTVVRSKMRDRMKIVRRQHGGLDTCSKE